MVIDFTWRFFIVLEVEFRLVFLGWSYGVGRVGFFRGFMERSFFVFFEFGISFFFYCFIVSVFSCVSNFFVFFLYKEFCDDIEGLFG